jgi:hypothetical protein
MKLTELTMVKIAQLDRFDREHARTGPCDAAEHPTIVCDGRMAAYRVARHGVFRLCQSHKTDLEQA